MLIAGLNNHHQLGEKSNTKCGPNHLKCISPPVTSHIKLSTLLSFSTFFEHSVWITENGQGYCVGNNEDGRICPSLPKKILKRDTKISIIGEDGKENNEVIEIVGEMLKNFSSNESN